MERLEQLINKLKEQFEKNVPHQQMLSTLRQIESELSHAVNRPVSVLSTAKVAVVMPASARFTLPEETAVVTKTEELKTIEINEMVAEPGKKEQNGWSFDPLKEIPTLAHQELPKDLNDIIGNKEESLNDKLKSDVREIASSLHGEPVKDLRKAIGINDRYVFISELFRGDEAMYERCIKTINNFKILPEAEYWMERELKLKLGWDETKGPSKHFYQLVKRRFS
ncbi:MAG TPA: hypothetical protein VMT76_14715 [Puia sp.]|nr:hypothetical protein [Puia sp.]